MKNIFKVKQCTIIWHDNDLKTLRVDYDVISHVLADIDTVYGKIAKMTITWGNIYKYLWTNINYFSPGKVTLAIVGSIGNMLDNIPEDIKWESATTDTHHIFVTAEDATKLS